MAPVHGSRKADGRLDRSQTREIDPARDPARILVARVGPPATARGRVRKLEARSRRVTLLDDSDDLETDVCSSTASCCSSRHRPTLPCVSATSSPAAAMPVRHITSPADLNAIVSEANGRLVVVDHTATWVCRAARRAPR